MTSQKRLTPQKQKVKVGPGLTQSDLRAFFQGPGMAPPPAASPPPMFFFLVCFCFVFFFFLGLFTVVWVACRLVFLICYYYYYFLFVFFFCFFLLPLVPLIPAVLLSFPLLPFHSFLVLSPSFSCS
jgi:hypothetical protein